MRYKKKAAPEPEEDPEGYQETAPSPEPREEFERQPVTPSKVKPGALMQGRSEKPKSPDETPDQPEEEESLFELHERERTWGQQYYESSKAQIIAGANSIAQVEQDPSAAYSQLKNLEAVVGNIVNKAKSELESLRETNPIRASTLSSIIVRIYELRQSMEDLSTAFQMYQNGERDENYVKHWINRFLGDIEYWAGS